MTSQFVEELRYFVVNKNPGFVALHHAGFLLGLDPQGGDDIFFRNVVTFHGIKYFLSSNSTCYCLDIQLVHFCLLSGNSDVNSSCSLSPT
jgi:hypothetical protein